MYLAWALPRREAVWWACQCVRAAVPPAEGSADDAALQAAQRWASSATEDHRRAAFAAGHDRLEQAFLARTLREEFFC